MRSTPPSLGGAWQSPGRGPRPGRRRRPLLFAEPIPSGLVLVNLLIAAGVLLFPLPALVLGARGLLKRPGYSADEPADRVSYIVLVTLRILLLVVVFALSVVILVSTIGASIRDVQLHGLVYVFFALDVLLALLIVFSFGRRDRRRGRRRATPAAR
jgi:hypothetical protein